MHNQDFESYAQAKPFNDKVNPVWERLFTKYLAAFGTGKMPVVLDYGCGDGKLFAHYRRLGLPVENIHGVEVSRLRVERCHALGWENARHIGLREPLPFADGTFDVVSLMEVIEHIPETDTDFYLKEIRRVLKEDGILLASTPNYPVKRINDLWQALFRRKWKRLRDDPTHVTFYNPRGLRDRLSRFFGAVEILCYKNGIFYPRIRHPMAMHKIIALCSPSALPSALLEGETRIAGQENPRAA